MTVQGDSRRASGIASPATGRPLRQSGTLTRWCPATEGPQASALRPRLFGEFGLNRAKKFLVGVV
jgi:hypothetical protein